MTNFTKLAAWVGWGVALILGAVILFGSSSVNFGNTYKGQAGRTEVNPVDYASGIQVGSPAQASMRTLVRDNVCNASVVTPFLATSTSLFYCSDPYVTAGDAIDVRLPAPASVNGSFIATGSIFSTTTGKFAFAVMNFTGASTSSFPLATTSISYSIYRTK